jgi:serine/threonine-protein kinase
VKIRVNSDPDGATIKEDGVELCSSTPCDLVYKGPDADPAKEHALTLSRAGFKTEARTVKVGDSPVFVKLAKAPEAPRVYVPPPAQAREQPKNEAPPIPTGYKTDLPY